MSSRAWDDLLALCRDDITYTLPSVAPLATTVTGKAAFLTFIQATFTRSPDARFTTVDVYRQPKGLAARCTAVWSTPGWQMMLGSGAVVFRLEEGKIGQIGVHLSDGEASAISRLVHQEG